MPVEITRLGAGKKYPTAALGKIAGALLAALKQSRSELSVALVGDREMRQLNARYRKKNQTTDVLSFFVEDQPKSAVVMLGDVVI